MRDIGRVLQRPPAIYKWLNSCIQEHILSQPKSNEENDRNCSISNFLTAYSLPNAEVIFGSDCSAAIVGSSNEPGQMHAAETEDSPREV